MYVHTNLSTYGVTVGQSSDSHLTPGRHKSWIFLLLALIINSRKLMVSFYGVFSKIWSRFLESCVIFFLVAYIMIYLLVKFSPRASVTDQKYKCECMKIILKYYYFKFVCVFEGTDLWVLCSYAICDFAGICSYWRLIQTLFKDMIIY